MKISGYLDVASQVFDQPDAPHQIPYCSSPASSTRVTPPPHLYDLGTYLIQFGARNNFDGTLIIVSVFNPNRLGSATEAGR